MYYINRQLNLKKTVLLLLNFINNPQIIPKSYYVTIFEQNKKHRNLLQCLISIVVRLEGVEPTTCGLGNRRSILLSYKRNCHIKILYRNGLFVNRKFWYRFVFKPFTAI